VPTSFSRTSKTVVADARFGRLSSLSISDAASCWSH
jgi:hypothetical protein